MTRREGLVRALILFRIVEQAEMQGIYLERVSQLVHRRFEGVETRHSARAAHVHRRADVAMHQATGDFEIRAAIEERGLFAAAFVEVIEQRRDVEVIVPDGEKLAFLRCPELDALLGARTEADRRKHHASIETELDGAAQLARSDGGHGGVRPGKELAAEA